MLASATEVEVELHVPDDVSTFFGVTWAQDPRKNKIFIKAFPRGPNGRRGILESTGLVELDDCLTAINGVSVDKSSALHEVMASIRAAESPLSLRFARYPPPPLQRCSPSSSLSSPSLFSPSPSAPPPVGGGLGGPPSYPSTDSLSNGGGGGGGGSIGRHIGAGKSTGGSSGGGSGGLDSAARAGGGGGGGGAGSEERRDAADPDLDAVLNSALVLGLGERVADIQKRNSRLLQEVDRIGRAAADKRQGVERVASAAASLTAAGSDLLPRRALRLLSAARQDAVALCEAMARLDELLAARERAQLARRRALEEEEEEEEEEEGGREAGGMMSSRGGGGEEGGRPRR
ncbi:hypothetical protein Esi_0074_0099 [Ectocarpus siliculosus]|uniref:PDZ domain-containing protein n=1 Tax=Ectocarpus siliculosus TaxID=2880 RepID=D8LSM8_ECTSI|nr:hypothetical protein Esi_0074_0099 [Ectocarpus siliculosus]|eukprot:CBN77865.1 hypothetical protein Esi_0074_0099 [Ectocarpus siliculosus]